MKLTSIVIIALLLGQTPIFAQEQPSTASDYPQGNRPKVKGIYLGMDIKSCQKAFQEAMSSDAFQGGNATILKKDPSYLSVTVKSEYKSNPPKEIGCAKCDESGMVTYISFKPELVNGLFNSGDLDDMAFRNLFAKAYNIPEWTMETTEVSYYDRSEDWKITIFLDREIRMWYFKPARLKKEKEAADAKAKVVFD